MIGTVRRAYGLLPRRLQSRWSRLAPLAGVSAALEMAGTAGVLALVQLIADPGGPAAERVRGVLAGWLGVEDATALTLRFAVALGVFYALKNLLRFGEVYLQARAAGATATYVTAGLIERYLRAPYPLHLQLDTATLMQRAAEGASAAGHIVLYAAVGLVSETLVVCGMLAVVIWRTPSGALGVAAFLGVILAGLILATQRKHTALGWRGHELGAATWRDMQQSLGAVREIKTLGREGFFVERHREVRGAEQDLLAKRQALEATPRLAVEAVFVAGLALLFLAASANATDSAETAATLGVLAYAGLRLLPSLHLIVYRYNRIGQGTALMRVIEEDWTRLGGYCAEADEEEESLELRESLRFSGVDYRYPGAERDALRGVELEIRQGESIGLVGPTGSGKSTLADLAVGLIAPTAGTIAVDGRPIADNERAWQRSVGYVPQTVHLIDDTLRRNIALGVDAEEIDEERVRDAVRQAQLEGFVSALPQGLDSRVGESGVKLSGGERQRVAIARALYRRPSVLLFDEATASLDNRTERALTDALESLRGEKTLILVAHRLTTVERCDRLVFLLDGEVADVGSYAELCERNERFRGMAVETR